MNDNTKICTCDTMNLEAITHLWNYRPRKFRSDAFLFWSRGPDSYRKNDRKRAVVWPWLVLQLSTVLALTQLGIRQSDWRRAGIRSTNLHIVVEYASLAPFCYTQTVKIVTSLSTVRCENGGPRGDSAVHNVIGLPRLYTGPAFEGLKDTIGPKTMILVGCCICYHNLSL